MQHKKINTSAYIALADALTAIFWNVDPFRRYLRGMLHDCGEILAKLDLSRPKRVVSGHLVDLLEANEERYRDVTLKIMLDVAAMERFPNLEAQVDRADMVPKAERAVAHLRDWTAKLRESIQERELREAAIVDHARVAEKERLFGEDHDKLMQRFRGLQALANPQKRGREFEPFLNELFALYDMEPRASYSLENEQIDGAFYFDTDHYILEAKWWDKRIERHHVDAFTSKIGRKGKNTLGFFVSMSGFTAGALAEYSRATPFITMDGMDLMAVLEQRIRLDDLIKRKKRHASETGQCNLPLAQILLDAG